MRARPLESTSVAGPRADGRRVSYRVGIGLQAKALARTVLDPDHAYRSVRWK
jgi:hypothetical protein